ncbi:phage tail protein [Enterococcus devriesei]|uniref:phage tail protein n=1 Tax=Enterococcus devriesei TaxID=319970 RepID=UPI0028ED6E82|nr:phage tail protein [Enterococcus devriesei]
MLFMNADEPNFVWNNYNAVSDMGCIIEKEILEISPLQRYETSEVTGRNGELHETFGDYEAYDLEIKDITIPYENLQIVKRWLRGYGKLITHNDFDKYRECICSIKKGIEFENEWGVFYTFSVVFRCQPFRRKVNETPIFLRTGSNYFHDPGDETSKPYLEIVSKGGNLELQIADKKLTVLNTLVGLVTIDNEKGKAMQSGVPLFTRGDWLQNSSVQSNLNITGNFSEAKLFVRSVWL